ncbi:MAG: IMP dehydrogenase [Thermoprotei archaeon]|jgi:IMP dehydrogenase
MVKITEKLIKGLAVFTFDDLIILPGYSKVEPSQIDLKTHFTTHIKLNIPFISAPMDTVTESEMAIALARYGGIGVIHRNCTIEEQVEMVKKVKRSESFIIRDVITIKPNLTTGEAANYMKQHNISGLPVVNDNGILIGIITSRDVRFADPNIPVNNVMTKDVIVAHEGITPEDAIKLMKKHKIEKLPLIDKDGKLTGLITYKDVVLRDKYPNAIRDKDGRLMVAAAISPYDIKRAKELEKYADALVIDVAHFHNENVIQATKKLTKEVNIDIIIGNLGTKEGVIDALTKIENVAGLRVGMGSGSVCTTTQITRTGAPTPFAVAQAKEALEELGLNIPIIADGGIRGAGDIALVLALGASTAMMGYVFAACKESPGPITMIGNRYYKLHRGMGSTSARQKRLALDRYSHPSKDIPEGIETWIPYKGEASTVIEELIAGLKAAMGYAGASNIKEMFEKAQIAWASPHIYSKTYNDTIKT